MRPDSQSPVILILSILTEKGKTLCTHMVHILGCTRPTIINCHLNRFWSWSFYSYKVMAVVVVRAPIIATSADRFSRCCWWRFSQFLAVSNNLNPSACHSLFIIFAPRRRCCLAAVTKGEGSGGTLSQQGPRSAAQLQQVDCHWGEVLTESRLRLHGTAMSTSDCTLDALLDHLRD